MPKLLLPVLVTPCVVKVMVYNYARGPTIIDSQVKQQMAKTKLGWETAWELLVLLAWLKIVHSLETSEE